MPEAFSIGIGSGPRGVFCVDARADGLERGAFVHLMHFYLFIRNTPA
jgi:hypothetical protein